MRVSKAQHPRQHPGGGPTNYPLARVGPMYYIIQVLFFIFFRSHTSTFQLLDKPWSQVSSLLPSVLAFNFYLITISYSD